MGFENDNYSYIKFFTLFSEEFAHFLNSNAERSLKTYTFEKLNNINFLPNSERKKIIEQETIKFYNMLNRTEFDGFVSYKFDNGKFKRGDYIADLLVEIYLDFEEIGFKPYCIEEIIDSEEYEEHRFTYDRATILEHLFSLKNQTNHSSVSNDYLMDLSDNKDIDKVRTLILLRVVDNLYKQPQYRTSIGALATALSGVVGIKADVLRSYLNAYLKNPDAKQNPMNNKKAVQIIKNKMGFK